MNNVKIGDVQEFKVKAHRVKAVQFTGTNGKEIVEFVREHSPGTYIRNGGRYLHFQGKYDQDKYTIRKGAWIVFNEYSEIVAMDNETFRWRHSIGKNNKLLS